MNPYVNDINKLIDNCLIDDEKVRDNNIPILLKLTGKDLKPIMREANKRGVSRRVKETLVKYL